MQKKPKKSSYQKQTFAKKPCKFCQKMFTPKRKWQEYDNPKCRLKAWYQKVAEVSVKY